MVRRGGAFFQLLLSLLLAQSCVAATSHLRIEKTPDHLRFASSHPSSSLPLPRDEVPSLMTAFLGLSPFPSWGGIEWRKNLFDHADAVATVLVTGAPTSYVPLEGSFPLAPSESPVDAIALDLSATTASNGDCNAFVYASDAVAKNLVKGAGNICSVITSSPTSGDFLSNAALSRLPGLDLSLLESLDDKNPAVKLLLAELGGLVGSLDRWARNDAGKPRFWSAVISGLEGLCDSDDSTLCRDAFEFTSQVVRAFGTLLSKEYRGGIVVQSVLTEDVLREVDGFAVVREKRESIDNDVGQTAWGISTDSSSCPKIVLGMSDFDNCVECTCFSSMDTEKKPWPKDIGCGIATGKTDPCTPVQCKNGTNDNPNIIRGATICALCENGYTLTGGRCYLSSNFPVITNIVLWVGISLSLGLLAIVAALSDIEAGDAVLMPLKDHEKAL